MCEDCKVAVRSSYRRLEAAVAHLAEELSWQKFNLRDIQPQHYMGVHHCGRVPMIHGPLAPGHNDADGRSALTSQRTPNMSSCRDHNVGDVVTTEEMTTLRSELADIRQRTATAPYTLPPPSAVNADPINSPQVPDRHISLVVHWTLKDVVKRKRNMIVISMPEDSATSDREQFVSLCESFLSIKPYVVSCKRLGETIEGRIRKLLVRLGTDAIATDLLYCAHRMLQATDSTVSSINADLSPAEAKLAFEARRRPREQVSQRQGTRLNRSSNDMDDIDVMHVTRSTPPNNAQPALGDISDEATGSVVVVAAFIPPVPAAAGPGIEHVERTTCDTKPASFQ